MLLPTCAPPGYRPVLIVKYLHVSHNKIFGKKLIYTIEANFKGICTFSKKQKEYMVKERLGTPVLHKRFCLILQ